MARSRPRCFWIVVAFVGVSIVGRSNVSAHDIPNARIDRSTQVMLFFERLQVNYEISLGELTLAQDLHQIDGEAFVGDRSGLFDRYARVVGPLNARGFLVQVNGREVDLQPVDFEIAVEDHLRIRFQFEAKIPDQGQLSIHDTNYASSEGSSRLGLRAAPGIEISGDLPPAEVTSISSRLPWQLTDMEERRTKRLLVSFKPQKVMAKIYTSPQPAPEITKSPRPAANPGLSRLLDHRTTSTAIVWLITAFFLGMVHALQPGHGKTLVAATSWGGRNGSSRGVLLGLITAGFHLVSVLAIAAVLWLFETDRFATIHQWVARSSGFMVATVGFFRLGRNMAGINPTPHVHLDRLARESHPSLWMLGLAGGIVPCWDAVALIVLASSIGQIGWGMILLVAFSLGLAIILVGVGWFAGRLQTRMRSLSAPSQAQRWMGFVSSFLLAMIGLSLLGS